MALPLLAGIAVGSLAVVLFNNKKEIKEKVTSCASKAKEVAQESFDRTKEFAQDSKKNVQDTLECIKEKKEIKSNEDEVVK